MCFVAAAAIGRRSLHVGANHGDDRRVVGRPLIVRGDGQRRRRALPTERRDAAGAWRYVVIGRQWYAVEQRLQRLHQEHARQR